MTWTVLRGCIVAGALCAAPAVLAGPASAEESLLPLNDTAMLRAFDDLESGRVEASAVESRCVSDTEADTGSGNERLGVAGFLAVKQEDAGRALCAALVRAVGSGHLAAQEIRDFVSADNKMRRAWAAGRVLREIFYAHEARQQQRPAGGTKP